MYDVRGRRIATLARGPVPDAVGETSLAWNRRTDRGERAPGGVYFVSVVARSAHVEFVKRVVVLP